MHDALRAFVNAILGLTETGADDVSLDLRLACNRWIRGSAALAEAPTRQAENETWWREKKYRSVA